MAEVLNIENSCVYLKNYSVLKLQCFMYSTYCKIIDKFMFSLGEDKLLSQLGMDI